MGGGREEGRRGRKEGKQVGRLVRSTLCMIDSPDSMRDLTLLLVSYGERELPRFVIRVLSQYTRFLHQC